MNISYERAKEAVGKYTALFHEPPKMPESTKMTDGPLLGNGDLGVSIGGPPSRMTWYIGKNDFWVQAHVGETGEQRMERLLRHGGDWQRRTGTRIIPVGFFDIETPDLEGAGYRHEQDLFTGEIRGFFPRFDRKISLTTRSWVAATENTIVVELTAGAEALKGVKIFPKAGERGQGERVYAEAVAGDQIWIEYSANYQNVPGRRSVGMAFCLLGTEYAIADDLFNKHFVFDIGAGETVVFVASILSDLDAVDFLGESRRRAADVTVASLSGLHVSHRQWWSDFWRRSLVEFGDPLLEQFYYGSQYILACCTREGKVIPGLFGNWITNDLPAWTGGYTLNYNYESPFWALLSSNRGHIARSYCDTLLDSIPIGRAFASKMLDCGGVYLPTEMGPWGTIASLNFLGQKGNALFAAINPILDFFYTWDVEFAGSVFPFLREVADFWIDYLVWDGDRYVITKDALDEEYNHSPDTNPIITLSLLRFFFRGILIISSEIGERAGVDAETLSAWSHVSEYLSDYTTFTQDGKTVFRLTEEGKAWNEHRGFAPFIPVYPTGEIGLGSEPAKLQIAYDSFEVQDSWDDYNAFCATYAVGARVGYDPTELLRRLRSQCLSRGLPNLQIFHGGGGIEECNGVPACINEMMLQSHDFVIRVFPNWEKGRGGWFANLRAYGGFFVTAAYVEDAVQYVLCESEKGRLLRFEPPWPGDTTVAAGKNAPATMAGEIFTIETRPGELIRFSQSGSTVNDPYGFWAG